MHFRTSVCGWLALAILCLLTTGDAQAQAARIARLIEQLGDTDFDKQDDARQQLEKLGEGARTALFDAIERNTDNEVRAQARAVLNRINAAKMSALIKQLGDDKAALRQTAEKELARIVAAASSKDAVMQAEMARIRLIRAMAKHPDLNAQALARRILTSPVEVKRLRELINQLGDDSFDKRVAAERALIKIGIAALDELKKASQHSDLEVRNRSAKIIKAITQEE